MESNDMGFTEIGFMERLIPEFKKINNNDYKLSMYNTYKEYMEKSEVPVSYIFELLENPFARCNCFRDPEIRGFVDNISEYLGYEFNCVFNFPTYLFVDKLASYIIQSYMKHYILDNKPIKEILYIDTPLLLGDLKRMISHNSDSNFERSLVYRLDTLGKGIENADFVIWDKMTNISTDYDRMELYRILSIRHKKGLGNLFCIIGGKNNATAKLSTQVSDLFYGSSLIDIT